MGWARVGLEQYLHVGLGYIPLMCSNAFDYYNQLIYIILYFFIVIIELCTSVIYANNCILSTKSVSDFKLSSIYYGRLYQKVRPNNQAWGRRSFEAIVLIFNILLYHSITFSEALAVSCRTIFFSCYNFLKNVIYF